MGACVGSFFRSSEVERERIEVGGRRNIETKEL